MATDTKAELEAAARRFGKGTGDLETLEAALKAHKAAPKTAPARKTSVKARQPAKDQVTT